MFPPSVQHILEEKYLQKDTNGNVIETPDEMLRRVATTVAQAEKFSGDRSRFAVDFYESMAKGYFLPNSPTLMNAGATPWSLSACYVLDLPDTLDGIYDTLHAAVKVQRSGGGTGFALSNIRPKGSLLHVTGGSAAGPIAFLKVFDASASAVLQSGRRRGANMAVLRVDHPDILEFIDCKKKEGEITNFNISVGITHDFMEAVKSGSTYQLKSKDQVLNISAREVFDKIVENAWSNGEPGVVFLDWINAYNPYGIIESTNPCPRGCELILTDKGMLTVKDIYDKFTAGEQISVQAPSGHFRNVSHAERRTPDKLLYVKLSNGLDIGVTPEHLFKTDLGDFVEASNIEAGNILAEPERVEQVSSYGLPAVDMSDFRNQFQSLKDSIEGCPRSWTEDLAFFVGYMVGDGTTGRWKNSHGMVTRCGFVVSAEDREELLPQLLNSVSEICGEDAVRISERRGYSEAFIGSTTLWLWLRSVGYPVGVKSPERFIPQSVWNAPQDIKRAFLRGLFTADGCVKTRTAQLNTSSRRLSMEVSSLLFMLKVASKIRVRTVHKSTTPTRTYLYPEGRTSYEVSIAKTSFRYFMEQVGFKGPKHLRASLDEWDVRKSSYNPYEVKEIKEIEPEDVYDLTVDEEHQYVCNGMIHHNCGETPLLPWESCNLASINLYEIWNKGFDPSCEKSFTEAKFLELLEYVVGTVIRFLDDVIDVNPYPLPEIREATLATRKIGLGVMGWADLLIARRIPYASEEAVRYAQDLMGFIQSRALEESRSLARIKGAWPMAAESKSSLVSDTRNAYVTVIAPTGTISLLAGCSSGIEPNFSYNMIHGYGKDAFKIIHPLWKEYCVENNIDVNDDSKRPKDLFPTAHDISPEWHVKMQSAFQIYTSGAVSKTINLPNSATKEDVANIFMLAHKMLCKGVTVYRDGSRQVQALSHSNKEEVKTEKKLGRKSRSKVLLGSTEKVKLGCGSSLYVTINKNENNDPHEVIMWVGKTGGCIASHVEAVGRLVSVSLQSGVDVDDLIEQLRGIRCPAPTFSEYGQIMSCSDVLATLLQKSIGEVTNSQEAIISTAYSHHGPAECPNCQAPLIFQEGCQKCSRNCGYTKCS